MNWAESLYHSIEYHSKKSAFWTPRIGYVSYEELGTLVRKTQVALLRLKVSSGDYVLLLDLPGPQLYAAAIAIVSLGASILFVEPWLPIARINAILAQVKPKVFWSPLFGQIWAAKVASIRCIPHWLRPAAILHERDPQHYEAQSVAADATAILSFTSGTSGQPKGIPRTHEYLLVVTEILKTLDPDNLAQETMVIFPNLVLYHLGQGHCAYIVPPKWPDKVLRTLGQLPAELAPKTVACGPAFLKKLLRTEGFAELRWIGVGGALLDANVLDAALKRFPKAHVDLIYGSTEVEPVAHARAEVALKKSQDAELFQITYLGEAIDEISMEQQGDEFWVTGPHVTKEYVQAAALDQSLKRRDSQGRIWHNMGDRIDIKADGLWYLGRSFQKREDFELEQRIYWYLQSSHSFLVRNGRQELVLVGEGIAGKQQNILREFPQLIHLIEAPIIRDIRHRARIDRHKTLRKVQHRIDRGCL